MQEDIYNEIVINKKTAMHNPDSFQQFFISTRASKLFNTILNLETTALHQVDCLDLHKKGLYQLFITCATV